MKILFCNIAWMKYYKGNRCNDDIPIGGGAFVTENQDAHEKYNFERVTITFDESDSEEDYCLGFVETKSTNGRTQNQLNIEKIDGCTYAKSEDFIEDVLVVYCALYPYSSQRETYVVGWYKHATVYRKYMCMEFPSDEEDVPYIQEYNAIAKAKDCVLLPVGSRRKATVWKIPRMGNGAAYGFGQANVWFASGQDENQNLKTFVERIYRQIMEYDGENWLEEG